MEMVGNQGILERGQEGHGMEVSSEVNVIGIGMKGVIGKGEYQGGGREMEHLLMRWGSRRSGSWTSGEGWLEL